MLGQFGLLPLLKGWEYKEHWLTRTLSPNEFAEMPILEMGWILQVSLITTDCYGTFGFRYQGSDLESHYAEINPEVGIMTGAFMPDPGGFVERYLRPNPYSTAGAYVVIWNATGYYGAAWPYVPTIIGRISLDARSTQANAIVSAYAGSVAITDKDAFIRSLRLALQSKADLGIDSALLTVGPSELGLSEKKVGK